MIKSVIVIQRKNLKIDSVFISSESTKKHLDWLVDNDFDIHGYTISQFEVKE